MVENVSDLPEAYQQELNRLAYEAQGYNDQIKAMQSQLGALQAAAGDLRSALEALRNLSKAKEGVFVPLGAGVLVNAKLTDSDKAMVDVGAGFIAEKKVSEAIDLLDSRMEKTEAAIEDVQKAIGQATEHLNGLDARAKEILDKGGK